MKGRLKVKIDREPRAFLRAFARSLLPETRPSCASAHALRERLGIAEFDPAKSDGQMVSLTRAAERLGICVGSAKSLVRKGVLPATQILPGSPWLVPADALTSEAVRIGVQRVIDRRPKFYENYQYDKLIRLPGI